MKLAIESGTDSRHWRIFPALILGALCLAIGFGRELNQAVNLIRGESGSLLRLRVVRQDESGNFRDRIVELTREQLVLGGAEDE